MAMANLHTRMQIHYSEALFSVLSLSLGSLSASESHIELIVGPAGLRKTHMSASVSRSENKGHCKLTEYTQSYKEKEYKLNN